MKISIWMINLHLLRELTWVANYLRLLRRENILLFQWAKISLRESFQVFVRLYLSALSGAGLDQASVFATPAAMGRKTLRVSKKRRRHPGEAFGNGGRGGKKGGGRQFGQKQDATSISCRKRPRSPALSWLPEVPLSIYIHMHSTSTLRVSTTCHETSFQNVTTLSFNI